MDVPAGWYPDPASPTSARWWDGSRWTEHTTPVDQLVPGQPTVIMPAVQWAPVATPVAVPTAPPELVATASPVPGFATDQTDTAVYPLESPYAAPVADQRQRPSVGWGVVAIVGVLALGLVVAAGLVLHGLTSRSGSPAAGGGATATPTGAPTGSAPAASPSPTGGATSAPPATAAQAAAVLETFKPTAADLPTGVEATLIDKGDVAQGQKTLDGWCSASYASEKNRIARRQWDLTSGGQSIGLSIEVVAYATPEQAAAALAEFTARTEGCTNVSLVEDGTKLTQDLVSSEALTGLPRGVTGYHGVVDVAGTPAAGAAFTGASSATAQRKGQYLSIVWTNQSTAISAGDQQVIDRFVAQQTAVLATTTS